MKNIKFRKIYLENFCCYISPMELEIKDNSLTLIVGINGCGKTSIFDSLLFTLYGVTSKGLRAKDVINNKIKRNCHTFVEFSIDDNLYKVDRYANHVKYGNSVIMMKNNKPHKNGHTDVVSEVEKILLTKKIFMNIVFFGPRIATFFTDLNDTERKEIFRKILNLDDYIIYNKKASELIKDKENILNDILNQIIIKSNSLKDYSNQIDLLIKEESNFKINNEKLINGYKIYVKNLNNKFNSYNDELNKYLNIENDLKLINNEININNQEINKLEIEFKNIVNNIQSELQTKKLELDKEYYQQEIEENNKFNENKNLLSNEENKLDNNFKLEYNNKDSEIILFNSQISSLKLQIENLNKEKNKFIKNIIDSDISICPTCNSLIDDKTINDLKVYISDLEIQIKNKTKEINDIDNEILLINNELNNIKKEYKINNSEIKQKLSTIEDDYNKNINSIKNELADKLIELKKYYSNLAKDKTNKLRDDKSLIDNKLNDLKDKQRELESNYNKYNQLKDSVIKIKSEIDKNLELIELREEEKFDKSRIDIYKNKINDIKLEIKKLNEDSLELKDKINILEFWKTGFSKTGIESILIDEAIPFLNERINKYLYELSYGRYILTFDTLTQLNKKDEYRDKITLNVLDNETLSDSRDKFSSGQVKILDIAIILTLCDLQSLMQNVKINLMILDEAMDSIDDENISRTIKLLKTLAKDKSIYVISHRNIDNIESDEILYL